LFAKAITLTNDYWHLPEYSILLDQLQEEISNASSGKKTVKQALDAAAEKNERTLIKAGYKIVRTANIPAGPDQIVTPSGMAKVEELAPAD
jgi:multiple sugar transport system substrate-binding protein